MVANGDAMLYLPAAQLSSNPRKRFAELFGTKACWKHDEIRPYIRDLFHDDARCAKSVDKLLLKNCRMVKGADNSMCYYKRF